MSDLNSVNIDRNLYIANQFAIDGEVIDVAPFGSGHINDTFKVVTTATTKYLLQRINHHIFQDVDGLMENIRLVIERLKEDYKSKGLEKAEIDKRVLTLIATRNGLAYYKDEDGDYWRMFILLDHTKSYDVVETTVQAYEGGKAFGHFQKQLSDLDANKLVEILPNFHNVEFRLSNLRNAISSDQVSRVGEVQDLLDYIFSLEDRMKTILEWGKANKLPLRITHNDTKFNNVLLDQNDQAQCVIDLDTVMPGFVAYDFGDAIRTIINSGAEDEEDLSRVTLNIPLFEAYANGYMSEAKVFLTDYEKNSLLPGVFLLPYMQAVRFLTDYLEGDHYYKIHYSDHNLVRTKSQLKLVKELELHENKLKEILTSAVNA
ncbi:phosphotransferase enzyme family protein [Sphingobacterium spiritivorum]|uniref:phosphotransferase enzyme family protein n=1 Tax=Sphingobacterium spiritivorum TaxID=258 RepID=UPI003DA6A106